jgi:hypothetical protein
MRSENKGLNLFRDLQMELRFETPSEIALPFVPTGTTFLLGQAKSRCCLLMLSGPPVPCPSGTCSDRST